MGSAEAGQGKNDNMEWFLHLKSTHSGGGWRSDTPQTRQRPGSIEAGEQASRSLTWKQRGPELRGRDG